MKLRWAGIASVVAFVVMTWVSFYFDSFYVSGSVFGSGECSIHTPPPAFVGMVNNFYQFTAGYLWRYLAWLQHSFSGQWAPPGLPSQWTSCFVDDYPLHFEITIGLWIFLAAGLFFYAWRTSKTAPKST